MKSSAFLPEPQITFEISNASAIAKKDENVDVIYMPTQDASLNVLSLTISNNTEEAIGLSPGTPVAETEADSASGSLFYLKVSQLNLAQSELSQIAVSLDGWTWKVFADTAMICLAPTRETSISPGGNIVFTLSNLTPSELPPEMGSAKVYMDFFRAGSVSTGTLPYSYASQVALERPPKSHADLTTVIAAGLPQGNTVVQTIPDYPKVKNTLTLTLSPIESDPEVYADADTYFAINFVYPSHAGDSYGYGALTTVARAVHFVVTAPTGWTVMTPSPDSQDPAWILTPPSGSLFTSTTTIDITISNIVTPYGGGSTLMLVTYSGVKGPNGTLYDDGAFKPLLLWKERHVYVHRLNATPNPATLEKVDGERVASVDVKWNAMGDQLKLTWDGGGLDVTGRSDYSTKIERTRQFTLEAIGASRGNYASDNVWVEIFPAINSMIANPQFIHYQDFPHEVVLDWTVDTNDGVWLTSSAKSFGQQGPYQGDGLVFEQADQPQMYTITPAKNKVPLRLARHEVISAFDLQSQTVPLSGAPCSVALSPTANLCAVAIENDDDVHILETISNTAYTTVSVSDQPAAVAFSNDGQFLFVAVGGDSPMLSVFAVAIDSRTNAYTFTKSGDVTLSGKPTAVRVSQDGTAFVAVNGKQTGALDIAKPNNDIYSTRTTVTFDAGPVTALAVLPSGAQAFVLCPAKQGFSACVYLVGHDKQSSGYQNVQTILFGKGDLPADIAIAGHDFSTLLVACQGSGFLYSAPLNIETFADGNAQYIALDHVPSSLAVSNNGAYAYIGMHADKKIGLLNAFVGYDFCKVVEEGRDNGAKPNAISVASDGCAIVVGNDDATLTVWKAKTFKEAGTAPSADGATNIVAGNDYVVSFQNARGGNTSSPGLWLYDRKSGTHGSANDTMSFTTFHFWPDYSKNKAIATVYGDNLLYVLDDKFGIVKQTPFTDSSTAQAVSATISPFSNMVFVVFCDGDNYSLAVVTCDIDSNDLSYGKPVPLFQDANSPGCRVVSISDGTKVFVTNANSREMKVVSGGAAGYSMSSTHSCPFTPLSMNISPDDREIYVWMNDAPGNGQPNRFAIGRFDVEADTMSTVAFPGQKNMQITSTDISSDGARIFGVDGNMRLIHVFSTSSMQEIESIAIRNPDAIYPFAISVTPDSSAVYVANVIGSCISIFDQLLPKPSHRESKISQRDGQSYKGIFLRSCVGDTAEKYNGAGSSHSPDIIAVGPTDTLDATLLGKLENYDTYYDTTEIGLNKYNTVYIRGVNSADSTQQQKTQYSRIYVYACPASVVCVPKKWKAKQLTYGADVKQNWVDVYSSETGEIIYTDPPLNWVPDSNLASHYCLVAWVSNSDLGVDPPVYDPPNLDLFPDPFDSFDDLIKFVANQRNMAWCNTSDIQMSAGVYTDVVAAQGVKAGGESYFGLKWTNVPAGSTLKWKLQEQKQNGWFHSSNPTTVGEDNTDGSETELVSWPSDLGDVALQYWCKCPDGEVLTSASKFVQVNIALASDYRNMLMHLGLRGGRCLVKFKTQDGFEMTGVQVGAVFFVNNRKQ